LYTIKLSWTFIKNSTLIFVEDKTNTSITMEVVFVAQLHFFKKIFLCFYVRLNLAAPRI